MLYRGYQPVIGLEIHVQLKTESKIFSSDSTTFDSGDNENTSPISCGMPGTLPMLNKKAIEFAIKAGIALNCEINRHSIFARKNYFYPDLPKGYQISQFDSPVCLNGFIEFFVNDNFKKVNIVRAHLEEDAGKSTHIGGYTLLNYNRAGVPLLEVVSGPDMHSAAEAAEYARTIRKIVRYLEVCDGNMEEGSLRCDCNVSVKLPNSEKLGTKVEIKNVNSFRFVEKAIEYEIDRQIDEIENGKKIIQETRLYDPDKNKTISMRTKEESHDYRYFPDPDLLPLIISESEIERIKSEAPELANQKCKRFVDEHKLPMADAIILTEEKNIAEFYEQAAIVSGNCKATANWIMTELLRELNETKIDINQSPVTPRMLGKLIQLIDSGKISGKIAKNIFHEMWKTKKDPVEIVARSGMQQITNEDEIKKAISDIVNKNIDQVKEYHSGKIKVFGFFIGQVMKSTGGRASPEVVNKLLKEILEGMK